MTAAAASATVRVEDVSPDAVKVSGELTFASAAAALDAISLSVSRDGRQVLDLGGVTRTDSAGLACVLAVVASAAEQGRPLTVRHMPEGMQLLARVCEVEGLLA
ncbi:STAS domain-containing protein [Dyella sp. ASV21]|uniref:STAS domain-containing protein n=1 Tax=Dyella sp. ASV21 TaxID=2795114 RepID=UPI0018EA98B3